MLLSYLLYFISYYIGLKQKQKAEMIFDSTLNLFHMQKNTSEPTFVIDF
jgi:hypothetical protein